MFHSFCHLPLFILNTTLKLVYLEKPPTHVLECVRLLCEIIKSNLTFKSPIATFIAVLLRICVPHAIKLGSKDLHNRYLETTQTIIYVFHLFLFCIMHCKSPNTMHRYILNKYAFQMLIKTNNSSIKKS